MKTKISTQTWQSTPLAALTTPVVRLSQALPMTAVKFGHQSIHVLSPVNPRPLLNGLRFSLKGLQPHAIETG